MKIPAAISRTAAALLGLLALAAGSAQAEETRVTVHVLSKDAKFIGSSMGGARVTLRDADTGELLAEGTTRGSTGDTALLVVEPRERYADLGTQGAAAFEAVLDLDRPTRIEIAAHGPLAQLQSAVSASSTRWVVPGKHLTGPGSVVIELAGFVVDVLKPAVHSGGDTDQIHVRTVLTML